MLSHSTAEDQPALACRQDMGLHVLLDAWPIRLSWHGCHAGQPCPITTPAGTPPSTLTCSLPLLPAGTWPVSVSVEGYGLARNMLPGDMAVTYSVVAGALSPLQLLSYIGGVDVTINGFGFVPTAMSSSLAAALGR